MIVKMNFNHLNEERQVTCSRRFIDPRHKFGNSFETRTVSARAGLSLKGRAGTPARLLGIVDAVRARFARRVFAQGVPTS